MEARRRTDPEATGSRRDTPAENETRRLLRELIRRSVPAVPRKLNRVGELYGLYLDVAKENRWTMEDRAERLTLLRLTILQLFAPDLYRFGRANRVFLAKMETWKQQSPGGEGLDLTRLEGDLRARVTENEKKLKEKPDDASAAGDLYSLKRIDLRLLAQIRAAQQQRSGFDPLRLVEPNQPSVPALAPFFNLDMDTRTREVPVGEPAAPSKGRPPETPIPVARTSDPESIDLETRREMEGFDDLDGFLRQLFSTDPLAWRNALDQEAANLADRVFDKASFDALLERVKTVPDFVQMEWLELIAPHLTAGQLFELYKVSGLLPRLARQLDQT